MCKARCSASIALYSLLDTDSIEYSTHETPSPKGRYNDVSTLSETTTILNFGSAPPVIMLFNPIGSVIPRTVFVPTLTRISLVVSSTLGLRSRSGRRSRNSRNSFSRPRQNSPTALSSASSTAKSSGLSVYIFYEKTRRTEEGIDNSKE
jgi:hypothetical protein